MACYAAVICLKKTIDLILKSSRIKIESPEIIQAVYRELQSFQEILRGLDSRPASKSRKKLNALQDEEIEENNKKAYSQQVWEFEDSLESLLSRQILSSQGEDERGHAFLFSVDLEGLRHKADSFITTLKDMANEYIYELDHMPDVEDDELGSVGLDFAGIKSEMVGLCEEFNRVQKSLLQDYKSNYPLIGMAGIGKSTLAKKIFQDPETSRWFEHRVWVPVGRRSHLDQVARAILAQVAGEDDKQQADEADSKSKVKERLKGKRCLIVLDDVWDRRVLDYLETCLPRMSGGNIKVLITTRLRSVPRYHRLFCSVPEPAMSRLKLEESVELLRKKVFGDEDIPHHLAEAVEKLAENCEGLPLMIITVASLIPKEEINNLEFWNKEADKRSSVFMKAYEEISKVLFPTYDCLPQHVKVICCYLGAFPLDYEIPVSKLVNLLSAERLSDHVPNLKRFVFDSLTDIMAAKITATPWGFVKSYHVYSCWCYLFKKEASKNKLLCFLNRSDFEGKELQVDMKGQHRLSLHSNFVFNFEVVYNAVKRDCASTARSLLCLGPFHQYSMPMDVGFKLLRILDALEVRFYEFPFQILELVLLQYLALTYNGDLPTSISKLFNLQLLIIHPHMSTKSWEARSHVPVQIWDMQELKHVEILRSCLPNPTSPYLLHELSTLVGVNASSCTEAAFKKVPNITTLGIQMELSPHVDGTINPLITCFNHISKLEKLKTLECRVLNPWFGAPAAPLAMFSSTLEELHLSGLGYPWRYMEVIGSLPKLLVLQLKCYAFQGPKWDAEAKSFLRLNFLIIEDADLVEWEPRDGSFPKLYCIKFKHCYRLKKLCWPSVKSGSIELVDCNPLAVTRAKKLETSPECFWNGKTHVRVTTHSTFEDGELKCR